MSSSPKRVRVDLLKQLNKNRTSPNKKNVQQSPILIKQFSFSNDLQTHHLQSEQSKKQLTPSPLAKKLFKQSSPKLKNHKNSKEKVSTPKQNIDKIRQKYRNFNFNYEQVDEKDRFFKKSIDKLKGSFFKNDGKSKQNTKKILKEIGKYAENRSKNKQKKQNYNTSHKEDKFASIPIEFYGFKNKDEKIRKTQEQREQAQKGTFLNFERAYELTIADNNKKINNLDYKSESVRYVSMEQRQKNSNNNLIQKEEAYQYHQTEKIGEKQIVIICQLFQFCNKLDQNDKLTRQDVNELVQQFQRRYIIKNAQKSRQENKGLSQIRFNNLIRDFQQDIKVIFYRKQQNNVYDTLFYLKQTNHLQLVCQDFSKIKNILQL